MKIHLCTAGLILGLLIHSAALGQSLKRGPYLQQLSPTSVVVRWRAAMDDSAINSVHYGTSPEDLSQVAVDGREVIAEMDCGFLCSENLLEKEVLLNGLKPDTHYYYEVGTSSSPMNSPETRGDFLTPPLSGNKKPLRVWILGDSGTGNKNAKRVRDAYKNYTGLRKTDLILLLGDNAYSNGTDEEYQKKFFEIYPDLIRNSPVWPCLGNHDSASSDSSTQTGPYFDMFTIPVKGEAGGVPTGTEAYYSFDYANVHFICLDSFDTDRSSGGAMMTWLKADLKATSQEWIIAFWHHPPYTRTGHNSDHSQWSIEMRQNALPLLEQFGADLVLSGHSHAYERSFYLDGHYGPSGEIVHHPELVKNLGNGVSRPAPDANGPYTKRYKGKKAGRDGTVYVVAGSSGKLTSTHLRHPAMHTTILEYGSMVLDIYANRLEAVFLNDKGEIKDRFSLLHEPDRVPPAIFATQPLNSTTLKILFSEPVDRKTGTQAAHYSINPGIEVLSAQRSRDGRAVILTTTELKPGQAYEITVKGVKDYRFRNAIPEPGWKAAFIFVQ